MWARVYYWREHGKSYREGVDKNFSPVTLTDYRRDTADVEVTDMNKATLMKALGKDALQIDEIHEHKLIELDVGRIRPYRALKCKCGFGIRAH